MKIPDWVVVLMVILAFCAGINARGGLWFSVGCNVVTLVFVGLAWRLK